MLLVSRRQEGIWRMLLSEANTSHHNGTHALENESIQNAEARHDFSLHEGEHSEDESGDDDDRRLLILYASQTGSAQDVAEYIGREAWRRHFVARVQDVRDFDKVRPPFFRSLSQKLQHNNLLHTLHVYLLIHRLAY